MPYFVVDIETCPNDLESYFALDEEKRLEKLNPIDSRVVAIGIRHNEQNVIFMGDEKEILQQFWKKWESITLAERTAVVVGFNITNFDLPFLTARSFINKVPIHPFSLKYVVDLRDKINAYRYGHSRGKLKEFAALHGLPVLDEDGSDVAKLWNEGKHDILKKYLENDIYITDELYKIAVKTRINEITRW